MSADIALVFGDRDGTRPPLERRVAELAQLAGVGAARAFGVAVVLGERVPASYPELVICELDDAGAALASLRQDLAPVDSSSVAAWHATPLGPRSAFELPGHLYLNFSAAPPSLSFAAYSDWYQVHQDENIAHSSVLRRGWRFRLERLGPDRDPGPSHLALYELDGTLEALTADLGQAMQAGAISLPDWFDRFASLEATAVGARL